jgi:hypothetical protein
MRFNLLCLKIILFCFPLFGQKAELNITELQKKISENYLSGNPQKIYVHFDKENYFAGENIWFKVYLVDAVTHLPDTCSSNLWVELINLHGELVDTRLLKPENGVVWGDFSLPASLPDGNYMIKAYTSWMQNQKEEFHFKKYFYIKNPDYKNKISRSELRQNMRFNKVLDEKKQELNFNFYPEGGNLVAGLKNRVAFKVIDDIGNGYDFEGSIINSKGKAIQPVETLFSGIGFFEITPELGENYQIVSKDFNNKGNDILITASLEEGYVFRIDQIKDSLIVSVNSNVSQDNPLYTADLYIIAHTRGLVHFGEKFSISSGVYQRSISTRLFPSGITHFTIFRPDCIPVNERLVFIENSDQLILSTNFLTEIEEDQEGINVLFNAIHPIEGPIEGSFSVSAQTVTQDNYSSFSDILNYLLVRSELNEETLKSINLQERAGNSLNEIDLIMLTHGWRRFSWEIALQDKQPEMTHSRIRGITIPGLIMDPANNKPIADYKVQLRVLGSHQDVYSTQSDNEGKFVFDGLEYNDEFKIEISAERLRNGLLPFIKIVSDDDNAAEYLINTFTKHQAIIEFGPDWKRPARNRGERSVSLTTDPFNVYGNPDQRIYIGERQTRYRSLFDVLTERATGFSIVQGQPRLRGASSFYGSNVPIFFVDGIQVDPRFFSQIDPQEVHRIDIFKGASSAKFGLRGANGAILAFTKRASNISSKEYHEFLVSGYYTPQDFFNDLLPLRENSEIPINPIQTVYWEPNLLTDQYGKANYQIPFIENIDRLKISIQGLGMKGGIGYAEYIVYFEKDKSIEKVQLIH